MVYFHWRYDWNCGITRMSFQRPFLYTLAIGALRGFSSTHDGAVSRGLQEWLHCEPTLKGFDRCLDCWLSIIVMSRVVPGGRCNWGEVQKMRTQLEWRC